jgi:hypothetical protein
MGCVSSSGNSIDQSKQKKQPQYPKGADGKISLFLGLFAHGQR